MKCPACGKRIGGRGIFDHGLVYCSNDCADKEWREHRADEWARAESEGAYTCYEDYMQYEYNATIADDHIPEHGPNDENWGPYGWM